MGLKLFIHVLTGLDLSLISHSFPLFLYIVELKTTKNMKAAGSNWNEREAYLHILFGHWTRSVSSESMQNKIIVNV